LQSKIRGQSLTVDKNNRVRTRLKELRERMSKVND